MNGPTPLASAFPHPYPWSKRRLQTGPSTAHRAREKLTPHTFLTPHSHTCSEGGLNWAKRDAQGANFSGGYASGGGPGRKLIVYILGGAVRWVWLHGHDYPYSKRRGDCSVPCVVSMQNILWWPPCGGCACTVVTTFILESVAAFVCAVQK